MTPLVTRDGWLMPEAVSPKLFAQWIAEAEERIELALPFVKERRVTIQAGGNLGIWPRLLHDKYGFKRVFTAEPDEINGQCLYTNTASCSGVVALSCAFGRYLGKLPWSRASEHKPGWHKIAPNGCRPKYVSGEVDVLPINNVPVEDFDLLALDVEGFELEALQGGERLLMEHRPVVIFEDMGRSRFEGFRRRSTVAYGNPPGAVQKWLDERGYAKVAEIHNDEVWALN